MMETECFLELAEGMIAYVYFRTARGEVTGFVVKLLVALKGNSMKFCDTIVDMGVLIKISLAMMVK